MHLPAVHPCKQFSWFLGSMSSLCILCPFVSSTNLNNLAQIFYSDVSHFDRFTLRWIEHFQERQTRTFLIEKAYDCNKCLISDSSKVSCCSLGCSGKLFRYMQNKNLWQLTYISSIYLLGLNVIATDKIYDNNYYCSL